MHRALIPLFALAIACAPTTSDGDGDGYAADVDCDDADATAHPDAEEVCDGVDNDCDGLKDEPGAKGSTQVYLDEDGDGWGVKRKDRDGDGETESVTLSTCTVPFGYVTQDGDCDDEDPAKNPDDGGC